MLANRLDLWGHLQAKALRLEAVCVLLAVTAAGLGGLTLWLATRPVPLLYPTAAGPLLVLPGAVPDTLAVDFAQQLVLLLGNTTPATAADAHAAVAKYLHPQLLLPFTTQMARERDLLRTDEMATQLAVRSATVTTPGGIPRIVTVMALRRLYVGKTPIRDEEVQATVTLLPVAPSPLNPYGLVVTALQLTPPLVPAVASSARLPRR
jgi:hypothetical protein